MTDTFQQIGRRYCYRPAWNPPSPPGASCVITGQFQLGSTMGLQDVINERVSFLKEQINPKNKPDVNAGFQIQMDILRDADPEKVAILVLRKKAELEKCRDVSQLERLYNELEALEWLQRQVVKHIA